MPCILLIGRDEALLEGLAQMLGHAGYVPRTARSAEDAAEVAALDRPLAVVVERRLAQARPELLRAPFGEAAAVIVYDTGDGPGGDMGGALPRAVLAELTLPHERQRLLALVERVATEAGVPSSRRQPPPEQRAR